MYSLWRGWNGGQTLPGPLPCKCCALDRSPRLIGLSLYRPIHDELNSRGIHVANNNDPFVFQSPCSWGAVYFPGPWRCVLPR